MTAETCRISGNSILVQEQQKRKTVFRFPETNDCGEPMAMSRIEFHGLDDKTHLNMRKNNENTHTHTQITVICFRFVRIAVHFDDKS